MKYRNELFCMGLKSSCWCFLCSIFKVYLSLNASDLHLCTFKFVFGHLLNVLGHSTKYNHFLKIVSRCAGPQLRQGRHQHADFADLWPSFRPLPDLHCSSPWHMPLGLCLSFPTQSHHSLTTSPSQHQFCYPLSFQ
jgi:hypothetical protein